MPRHQTSRLFERAVRLGLIAFGLLSAPLPARSAAPPAVLPHVDDVNSGKSLFVDDAKFGKDPFFPKSSRRVPQIVTPVNVTPDTGVFNQVLSTVALKGISGLPGKRLALLGNRTLEAGEEFETKFNNQIFKVHCVEVREKSVVISVEGSPETKEIHLRPGS